MAEEDLQGLYQARELLGEWVRYYNEERVHSALNYLRPMEYYIRNPDALLQEKARKLRDARAKRLELNRISGKWIDRRVP